MVVAQYSLGAYPAPRPASLLFSGTSYRFYRGCGFRFGVGFERVLLLVFEWCFVCV